MADSGDSDPKSLATTLREAVIRLLHPVPLVALLIISGVLFLLGTAIMDWDKGKVLSSMGRPEYARGLITYLFALVTIGTAIVLVLSALLGTTKERFEQGKDILGLLLGVFGTIVGFYFGSELVHSKLPPLSLTSPLVAEAMVPAGGSVRVTAAVDGGTAPYTYGLGVGSELPERIDQPVRGDGWIVTDVTVPAVAADTPTFVVVAVRDASGAVAMSRAPIVAKASRPSP